MYSDTLFGKNNILPFVVTAWDVGGEGIAVRLKRIEWLWEM